MGNYLDKTGLAYFWGKLKSYIIAIPNPANGRLAYHNDADFNAITKEWCLAKGVNSPDSASFYYLHTIAYMANSDGTVNVGKQIAFSYSSTDEEVYVRRRAGGTWTAWQKSPTRSEIDALDTKTNLTLTRTEQTHVNATSFSRLSAVKRGNMLSLVVNLEVVYASGFSGFEKIGTINGWSAAHDVLVNIPSQSDGSKVVVLAVRTNGNIEAYSATSYAGTPFFRAQVTVPAA